MLCCCCCLQERRQQHDPPGQYEGETALHIAVVNRDFDMVKFLVQVRWGVKFTVLPLVIPVSAQQQCCAHPDIINRCTGVLCARLKTCL